MHVFFKLGDGFLKRTVYKISQVRRQTGDVSFTTYNESLNHNVLTLVFFLITHCWMLIKIKNEELIFYL